jgi:hypothetical protein
MKMNKKSLIIGVILIFLIYSVSSISTAEISRNRLKTDTTDSNEVDQQQNISQGPPMPVGQIKITNKTYYIQTAQSFIPQKDIITKIEILVGKNTSANYSYTVAIRDNLNDSNLVEKAVDPNDIVTQNFSWLEVNIDDLFVNTGQTYYLVCYTENATGNWYLWSANNDSESYPYGEAYYSLDNGSTWSNNSKTKNSQPRAISLDVTEDNETKSIDMCFKIYGRESTELDIEFNRFGKGLTTSFKNIGTVNATSVIFEVKVKGGFLGKIDTTTDGLLLLPITPNGTYVADISFFGLGFVDITATAYASNAPIVTKTAKGFVVLSYIIILPTITV